jgi:hypothetical protein
MYLHAPSEWDALDPMTREFILAQARAAHDSILAQMENMELSEGMKAIWWNEGGPKPPWRAMVAALAKESK